RKKFFIGGSIAAQSEHILYTQKMQVNQSIFRFFFAEPAADKMRNSFYFVFIHNSGANAYRARTLSYFDTFKTAVLPFFINLFRAMICNIYKAGFKFHQGIKMTVNRFDALALCR